MEGLGKRGVNVGGALRQPSGGPTMNVKGTAAGGGNSLLIPMTEFSLGLTGDINDIMNAHNLAMVALTSRMQHERNYNDEQLQRLTGMRRLDIDPTRVEMGWIMDFCAQALRNIVIGLGGRFDGYTMQSKFGIAVGSECMAILAVIRDLADLKERLNNITVAFDKSGKPVTTGDLEVGNAMTAFMRNTINPTLMCTAEYNPCMVHAGPFANIAVGQSSIIADRVGLEAVRLPRNRVRLCSRHRLRKILERQVPVQRPQAPCVGPDLHHPRPQDARRRPQGCARHRHAR